MSQSTRSRQKWRIVLLSVTAWLHATAFAIASPCVYWTGALEETASALKAAGVMRICVPPDRVDGWRAAGFEPVATTEADLATRTALPVPGLASRLDLVSSTRSPWIDANGWRFVRKPDGQFVYELPAGRAALAAAEASMFDVDAVLKIDPADLPGVGEVLAFGAQIAFADLPPVADIAVVDDGTAEAGEAMNLLARRNLLYTPVAKRSSSKQPIIVALGTKRYPRKAAANPSEFAQRVRRELTDPRRTLRIYGSEVVLARLTGDDTHRRLLLINYGGRDVDGLRVRLLGSWQVESMKVAGKPDVSPQDVAVADGATEFSIPALGLLAVVDLTSQ